MRNFKITIQYEGTRYQGWQKQGSTDNTLQGKFEALLTRMAKAPVEIAASGRTDAGVHAWGQVANFHMDTEMMPKELMEKINSYLPEDVAVISCEEVPERFHSRLNAKKKTYRYRILNSPVPSVFDRRYVWQLPDRLDVEAMKKASCFFLGTHDFKSFTSAKKSKKSTVRSIQSIEIERVGNEVVLTFTGDGFLFHMVRILTGTLVEVGLGKRNAEEMEQLLLACDRQLAGPLAPACGLALMRVYY
ncbi:MAG: tRNA pseudouridine(38-40) synthase TruA [Lachnospiraceae bacterium]|nr:tRNA pseudouridine(38-40) synthase TruA [Lachnospiraceae bacterium]